MDIRKIPAARLNPAAYNPRKDLKPGDKEYEKLKRSIAEFGFVEPVIWNRQTGNVSLSDLMWVIPQKGHQSQATRQTS